MMPFPGRLPHSRTFWDLPVREVEDVLPEEDTPAEAPAPLPGLRLVPLEAPQAAQAAPQAPQDPQPAPAPLDGSQDAPGAPQDAPEEPAPGDIVAHPHADGVSCTWTLHNDPLGPWVVFADNAWQVSLNQQKTIKALDGDHAFQLAFSSRWSRMGPWRALIERKRRK